MTITIPVWLLWTVGCAIGTVLLVSLLFFAVLGWRLSRAFDGINRGR